MSEEQLDRFARGECTPEEARALAQKALDNPSLFDELTSTAIARRALAQRRPRRDVRLGIAALAMAAAVVIGLVFLYSWATRKPALVATATPPIFLASTPDANSTFRGSGPESRAPRATGLVTSIGDGTVNIDLGSLDGLTAGAEVEVVRDGRVAGSLGVRTLFRERARAEAPPGFTVHVNDEIRVTRATHLRAVLDQIEAFSSTGDFAAARRIAEQDPGGDFDIPVNGFVDLNNLAVLAELHGNRPAATSLYERALGTNPPGDALRSIERNYARIKDAR